MKEIVNIHDFLVTDALVGDWDGMEEHVAEQINEFYHTVYSMAEEDISTSELTELLTLIWDIWIGEPGLADIEIEEIHDWCQNYLDSRSQFLHQD